MLAKKYVVNSKAMSATIAIVLSVAFSTSASARDGKAWGGQCIVSGVGGAVSSESCNSEGVSCIGNGRGGTDCTWVNTLAGSAAEKVNEGIIISRSRDPILSRQETAGEVFRPRKPLVCDTHKGKCWDVEKCPTDLEKWQTCSITPPKGAVVK